MTITKIEYLTQYSTYEVCGHTAIDRSDTDIEEKPEFYSAKEVEALVRHLQSKIPKWKKLKDERPRQDEPLLIISRRKILPFYYREDQDVEWSGFYFGNSRIEEKDIEYWCYADEFMKTLPEGK